MIEIQLINYLKEKLNLSVTLEEIQEDEYIRIECLNYPINKFIDRYTVIIQSYSTSKYNACLLNQKVIQAMEKFNIQENIASCNLENAYDFTDTTKKKNRYQATFEIILL